MKKIFLLCAIFLVPVFFSCQKAENTGNAAEKEKKIKAGFIYVGPIGDYGWSNAHENSRQELVKKYPWLETVFVESVPEGDCARVIDRLVTEEKCDAVFTTSFGYMDATIAAGAKYPDKIFMHCSGYKQAKNVGTYFAELYQVNYLNGLMAGGLTKSNKIGYVGAHPIPEVVRHINAYALGIKEVNPKAKVYVKWLYSWYDPAKAREAAESLIAEGCDVFAFTEDSIGTIEVGQAHTAKGHPVYTFSHYSPMQKFGPDSVVSGQLVNWTGLYSHILEKIHSGTWTNEDLWWRIKEKAALLGGAADEPVNKKFVEKLKGLPVKDKSSGAANIYDLVMKRYGQMDQGADIFEPFTGPIKDQKGNLWIKPGESAGHDLLWSMDKFIDNVIGNIPKS